MLLCAGDFFGPADVEGFAEDIGLLLSGGIKVPIPTYIIAGTHVIPQLVSDVIDRNHGEVCENLVFLGRHGVMTTAEGLKIAFLSGVAPSEQNGNDMDAGKEEKAGDGDGEKEEQSDFENPAAPSLAANIAHYTVASVRALTNLPPSSDDTYAGVDILLTAEWPSNILEKSHTTGSIADKQLPGSSNYVTDIALARQPRYHFSGGVRADDSAGDALFWEREPYRNRGGAIHVTRFIGLGAFAGANKARWFYAFNIVPLTKIEAKALAASPANVTDCPFPYGGSARKRPAESEEGQPGNFFWGGNAGQGRGPKRQYGAPPSHYVCRKCGVAGHWIQDCQKPRGPREGHNCRVCGASDHFTQDCPKKESRERQCWFCLSNPDLEKHLIVSIGSEIYLTLAKGGLVDWGGHTLLVPIGHYPSSRHMEVLEGDEGATARSAMEEMERYKAALAEAYAGKGASMVCYELYAGGGVEDGGGLLHMHLQVVPIPTELEPKIEVAFMESAKDEGLELVKELPSDLDTPYCRVEVPTAGGVKILTFVPSAQTLEEHAQLAAEVAAQGRRPPRVINLQFGRLTLATLLGQPDRANWKNCILPHKEERRLAEELRRLVPIET
ncbi:hypothetical protein HK104_006499 [Borealophlyctis nickersoniae]|nr:hypothetical protein HK104_006499 [Borealophlyctis nickersoniae]